MIAITARSPCHLQISQGHFKRLWLNPELTTRAIAAQLGVSKQAVLSRAKYYDLPRRIHIAKRIEGGELFAEMWAAGVPMYGINAHFKRGKNWADRCAKRAGLPSRGKGWTGKISVEDFMADRLRKRMEASARADRAQWRNAEMVDGKSGNWAVAAR